MTRILITGSNGYVGSNIIKYYTNHNLTLLNRNILDLKNTHDLDEWFKDKYFDVVVHTAIKGGSRLYVDDSSILDDNIKMYLNIVKNRDHFGRFINIGSGAEINNPNSFYGLSKKVINASIQDKINFYNLRIYGIFNHNEIDSRFIKNSINRYINNSPIIIFKNKLMDFIYFEDFIKILDLYISTDKLPKNIDCVYHKKYSLQDIAKIINLLESYSVDIDILDSKIDENYIGQFTNLDICFDGIEKGILNTYRKIKNEKSMVCS